MTTPVRTPAQAGLCPTPLADRPPTRAPTTPRGQRLAPVARGTQTHLLPPHPLGAVTQGQRREGRAGAAGAAHPGGHQPHGEATWGPTRSRPSTETVCSAGWYGQDTPTAPGPRAPQLRGDRRVCGEARASSHGPAEPRALPRLREPVTSWPRSVSCQLDPAAAGVTRAWDPIQHSHPHPLASKLFPSSCYNEQKASEGRPPARVLLPK